MSTPSKEATPETDPAAEKRARDERWQISRRGWTVLLSFLIVITLGLVGAFCHVPFVALGPGPTYDTLGSVDNTQIVQVEGAQTYPTTGQLRMTTVSLKREVTLFSAFGLWVSGRYALAPREEYIKPGQTEDEVQQQNVKLFQDSQSDAEVAAMRFLNHPVKVVVSEVTAGAPADRVIEPGDRLLRVNGKQITQAGDVVAAVEPTKPGQVIEVVLQRNGQERTVSVTLGSSADRPQGYMGIRGVDRADVPFKTTIHLQDVGGPSAGLIFSLAIIDRLTPDDLAGGQPIAGTGEIDTRGVVGPIGGIGFKLVAAAEDGAKTFLVPAANCAEALADPPPGLQLIKVETLAGAVQALEDRKAGRPVPGC
ncbi:PDZ domain-containing protein [Kibdelosporangium philippinense]|uniref:PDZ domain-containing protein n=1 Tax=Kibdelosporangium philippinense TaxID=211113 RepID=A0ABS8ZMQ1_9PSEU|nr:PDZ domain-containing protein [Kibdelosporangium philippinense]MCE7008230.1 PDZ domain-containing protein [Kibdelosporangium philippinense]